MPGFRRSRWTAAILDEAVDGLTSWTKELDHIGFDAKRTTHLRKTIAKRLDALR